MMQYGIEVGKITFKDGSVAFWAKIKDGPCKAWSMKSISQAKAMLMFLLQEILFGDGEIEPEDVTFVEKSREEIVI